MMDKKPIEIKSVEIAFPEAPPAKNLVPSSGITVQGTVLSGAIDEMKARVYRQGQPIPDEPDPNDPSYGSFPLSNIPGARGNADGTYCDNILVVWSHNSTTGEWQPNEHPFCGVTAEVSDAVSAKCCLWFAWVPLGTAIVGPEDEDSDAYRPRAFSVPVGANSVTISAAGEWQHCAGSGCKSGPEGRSTGNKPTRALENERYKSDYGASGVDGSKELPLNMLVGLWEFDGSPPQTDANQPFIEIGAGGSPINVPGNATRLFLGFHDGRHWTNNGGSVDVTIQWSED